MNEKKYKIVILCGANPYKGPGIIALDLYKTLRQDGHTVEIMSNMFFLETDKNIKSLNQKQTILKQTLKKLRPSNIYFKLKNIFGLNKKSKYLMFSLSNQNSPHYSNIILKSIHFKPDIFIYMFSHQFLNPVDLKEIYAKFGAPILYWLVDSAAMTGGCHFTWDCEGYKYNCGKCPGIESNNINDQTSKNLIEKKRIFESINIKPIYSTEIQRQMLSKSTVFKNIKSYQAYVIVDENKFLKSILGREKYNLPKDKKLIYFAANQIDEERKGMKLLNESLKILSNKLSEDEKNDIVLVIAGNNFKKLNEEWSFNYIHLGYLSQNSFAEVMCCVDLFICPSIEDSGPMVINQSLMCGTPVVAFEMGIAKDFIKNSITGYLAKLGDEIDLANGIYSIITMSTIELQTVSENCRNIALKNFSCESVLIQFKKIFDDLQNINK